MAISHGLRFLCLRGEGPGIPTGRPVPTAVVVAPDPSVDLWRPLISVRLSKCTRSAADADSHVKMRGRVASPALGGILIKR